MIAIQKNKKIANWNRQEESVITVGRGGSILEDRVIYDNEEVRIENKRNKLTPQQKAILRHKYAIKEYTYELGGYIHMYYVNNELLFNKLNIDRANISRLIMLATFLDYNDREENLLITTTTNNKIVPMKRKDIQYVLKLSDTPFKKFLSEMKNINMIYEVDKKLYLSTDYFTKGKSDFKNKNYTRIFIDTVRTLYEGCTPRQHKQLGCIFQLVPFIHYDSNILCSNPDEKDYRFYNRLNLKRICELLNIATDPSNMNRLETDLLKFSVAIDEYQYYVFKRVVVKGGSGKFDYFVINPQVIWSGNDMEKANETINKCFFTENL